MSRCTSTLFASLALLALPLPGWSADPPGSKTTDKQPVFTAAPPTSKSKSSIVKKPVPTNYPIRDPAMAASSPVERANHEVERIPKRGVVLAQFREERSLDALNAPGDVTDDLQLDLEAAGRGKESATNSPHEALNVLDSHVADSQDGRLPTRSHPRRRHTTYANQPWTISAWLNDPNDYYRQACEEEFCHQMWACAGGRRSSWFHRWRRDMRRGYELGSMGGCGLCGGPSSLLSGLLIHPLLGYGLFGGRPGACDQCQSASGLWGNYCGDGGCASVGCDGCDTCSGY